MRFRLVDSRMRAKKVNSWIKIAPVARLKLFQLALKAILTRLSHGYDVRTIRLKHVTSILSLVCYHIYQLVVLRSRNVKKRFMVSLLFTQQSS